jgi:2,3-bisphosphoglycerate-dependent phosphoglycerate mutase
MELYIIRHGQSTNNVIEDVPGYESQRVSDPPLTELGQQQAEKVAEFIATTANPDQKIAQQAASLHLNGGGIGITHLYCSAMHRALQTARPIAKALRLQPEVWLDIHEQGGIFLQEEHGLVGYPGMTRTEIITSFPDYVIPESITDQGWWRVEDACEDWSVTMGRAIRVAKALRERADNDERIAIISHGTFIDVLLKALFNQLPSPRFFYYHYNTAVTRLDFLPEGRIGIRYINRFDHLPPDMVS